LQHDNIGRRRFVVTERDGWRRTSIIVALGISQTLAWASSYYLVAILAKPTRSWNQIDERVCGVFGVFADYGPTWPARWPNDRPLRRT
jgi:hypothetical protein